MSMRQLNTLLFFLAVFSFTTLSAQDKLFTQAFAHPVDLNPAFAGAIDGRYRVTIAYRDQWRSIVESPYTTMGVYGDVKITLPDQEDDFFGGGFSLISDRTAIFNVNQNSMSLYGSYHKALNRDLKQYLSGGLYIGIVQRNLNYEDIYFNDQFNGLDEYALGTAEILPANNFAFADIGAGITYSSSLGQYGGLNIGIAMDHLPGSSISFYNHSVVTDEEYPDAKIDRKLTAVLALELATNEYVSFMPRILWQQEGPHKMLAGTALVKFDISNYNSSALNLGGGMRFNQTRVDGFKPSSAYVMMAYEVSGLLIGLSHDIQMGGLGSVDPGKGAFEFSLSFTGHYENEDSMCPSF